MTVEFTPWVNSVTPFEASQMNAPLEEICDAINEALELKADADHDHSYDYSSINHDHNGDYADLDHDHGYDYSSINHDHDGDYADLDTLIYVVAGSYGTETDLVPDSKIIFRHKFCEITEFAINFSGSNMWAEVAATAQTVFSITKNGSQIGTATFAISGTSATFTLASATTFQVGDILRMVSPVQDTTLAGIAWTLKGTRV